MSPLKYKGTKMKKIIAPILLFLLILASPLKAQLSNQEKHRLGSYLGYIVVVSESLSGPAKPDEPKPGDWCPDCTPGGVPLFPGHPGKIGDGTVFQTCGTCNGTQKIGSMPMSEEEANEITEELEGSGGFTGEPLNQSQVRHAGDLLSQAIRDAHEKNNAEEEQESQEEKKPLTPEILCFEGSAWTFENKRVREATNDDMREHLIVVHGIDSASANKMTRDELIALHNLIHNSEVRASAPSASCPDGSCPASGSGSSCPTCPSGSSSSSSSRSRGFFRRR